MELEPHETRQVIVTTTLIIVLFTVLFLGGSTMPMMKVIRCLLCLSDVFINAADVA